MVRLAAAAGCLLVCAGAHAACSDALTHRITASQHLLDSLHPDKPGQLRVLAFDGAAYSAGEARWMTGQMQRVRTACERSDEPAATLALGRL